MENNQEGSNGSKAPTAFLVDLVSNRKIPVATPRCRVGRDDLNDIVISGDQSISRFHFIISYENNEFTAQDAKSRHGTFLNGNQLTSPETIKDGDVLKVGVSLFWFVVESADKTADELGRGSPIQGQEEAKAVEMKTPQEGDEPTPGAKDHTVEMSKPDASLIEKLEQAANSIQIEEKSSDKSEPKASLASLLSPLSDGGDKDEADSKDKDEEDVKAKLAARDAELLKEIENAAEAEASSNGDNKDTATSDSISAVKFPEKILNKPSDTVTIEALPLPENLKSQEEEDFTPQEKIIEPPRIPLGNLLAQSESKREEEEKEREREEALAKQEEDEDKSKLEEASAEEAEAEVASSKSDAKELIKEQSQTGEIAIGEAKEAAQDLVTETANSAGTEEASTNSDSNNQSKVTEAPVAAQAAAPELSVPDDKFQLAGANAVPDWCKKYFSDEIGKLNKELDELNDQVKLAQQKIRDVETRVALTRGIRNTLLTTTGDELVEACGKVLGLLGWKVTIAAEDKHELRLEVDDKHVCIARVIWTTTQAERSHLGQLSISQTRYWCEKGVEPKGILIVSKIGDGPPQAGGTSTEDVELADYAAKKNVCLMTTLQLLALYKDVALGEAKPDVLRTAVAQSSGWLEGYNLEPGTAEVQEKDEAAGNKLSSLLSA